MNLTKHIAETFRKKKTRGWPKVFISIDLHGVVLTPTYKRFNEGAELYPGASEVLYNWTKREDVCLILWSSSHDDSIGNIRERLFLNHGIVFDYVCENPEQPTNELCDFDKKFYFDIVLDDKGGFEGEVDWLNIETALKLAGEF